MNLGIPQIIYLALNLMGLGVIMSKHGQPRDEKYNVWTSLLMWAIVLSLLTWGGFFK